MSIALVFFKKRGSQEADDFRGVVGFRGCPLNEWDYLSLDPQLRDLGVRILVKEYGDVSELDSPYDKIVTQPICLDLRYDGEKSEQYPQKGELTSTAIKTWILSILQIKKPSSIELGVDDSERSDNTTETVDGTSPAASQSQNTSPSPTGITVKDTAVPKGDTEINGYDEERGLLGLGLGLAGTLLVAALALAGGMAGSALADRHDDSHHEPGLVDGEEQRDLFLLPENGDVDTDDESNSKIDFKSVEKQRRAAEREEAKKSKSANGRKPWEEAPPKAKSSTSNKNQPSETPKAKSEDDPTIGF